VAAQRYGRTELYDFLYFGIRAANASLLLRDALQAPHRRLTGGLSCIFVCTVAGCRSPGDQLMSKIT
jgi:hypothetical protein